MPFRVMLGSKDTAMSDSSTYPKERADEDRLVADMIELTRQYGRYAQIPPALNNAALLTLWKLYPDLNFI